MHVTAPRYFPAFMMAPIYLRVGFPGGAVVQNLPANAGDARNVGTIPGSGRYPGEGNGNPLQDSCLEKSMDRGAWRVTVHGVTKTEQLNNSKALTYTPSFTKQATLLYYFFFFLTFYFILEYSLLTTL